MGRGRVRVGKAEGEKTEVIRAMCSTVQYSKEFMKERNNKCLTRLIHVFIFIPCDRAVVVVVIVIVVIVHLHQLGYQNHSTSLVSVRS